MTTKGSNHGPQKPYAVYMDGLNYNHVFFTAKDWNLSVAYNNVKRFVKAAKNSNIALKVFIDATTDSDEALEKWRSRRMRQIVSGQRPVPQGLSILLADMFKMQGIPVLYSAEIDCDDTLAFHAHHDGAAVLSRDKDFWRYIGSRYKIYVDFTINGDHLILHPGSQPNSWKLPPPRPIGSPPAVSVSENGLSDMVSQRLYRRGAPSPLIRALGFNPHVTAQPLRIALYSKVFFEGDPPSDTSTLPSVTITEEFPIWNAEEEIPDWYIEEVLVKNDKPTEDEELYRKLLHKPDLAFKQFFPTEHKHLSTLDGFAQWNPNLPQNVTPLQWHQHCSACRGVIYGLCCDATGQSLLKSLLPAAA